MDCPKCGAQNPDGAEYCSLCFERFEAGAIDVSGASPGHAGLDASALIEEQVAEASSVSIEPAIAEPSPPDPPVGFHDKDLGSLEELLRGEPNTESLSEFEVMPVAETPQPVSSGRRRFHPHSLGGAAVKLSDMQPEDDDPLSLFGFAVAIGVTGAVIYRVATLMMARYAAVGVATGETRVKTFVFGILFTLGVVFGLSFLVGWRSRKYGAVLGSVTALILCIVEGALSAMGVGAVSTIAEEGVNFYYCLAFYAAMVGVGAFSGWLGEAWKTNKDVGGWSFDKALVVVGGSACALLFLVGIGGLIFGGGEKTTSSHVEKHVEKHAAELVEVFDKMNQHEGWQADIAGDSEGLTIAYRVLYQKDVGYLVSADYTFVGGSTLPDTKAYYAVLPNEKEYEYEKHTSYNSSPSHPSTSVDLPTSIVITTEELEEESEEELVEEESEEESSTSTTEHSIRDSSGEPPRIPTRSSSNKTTTYRWDRTTERFAYDLFNPDLVDKLEQIVITRGSFLDQDCVCYQADGDILHLPGFVGPQPSKTNIWVSEETGEILGVEILQAESTSEEAPGEDAPEEEPSVEESAATDRVICVFTRLDEKVLDGNAFFPCDSGLTGATSE